MPRRNNLVSLNTIERKIIHNKLDHLVTRIGFARYPKKYFVELNPETTGSSKRVSFGHRDYEDYLIHKNPKRREMYRQRHRNDNIDDPTSPGFWSWHILW